MTRVCNLMVYASGRTMSHPDSHPKVCLCELLYDKISLRICKHVSYVQTCVNRTSFERMKETNDCYETTKWNVSTHGIWIMHFGFTANLRQEIRDWSCYKWDVLGFGVWTNEYSEGILSWFRLLVPYLIITSHVFTFFFLYFRCSFISLNEALLNNRLF